MFESKKLETAIGVFVLLTVTIITAMILVFGGATNPFVAKFEVEISFKHIGDLRQGAPVKLGGVRIGSISEIELQRDGLIKVTASIREDTPLRSGTKARIETSGLVGDTFVELTGGNKQADFPKDGSEIIDGSGQVTTNEILHQVNDIGTQVTSLVENLNGIIGEDEFKNNIHNTVKNTSAATKVAEKLLLALKNTSDNIALASKDILETTGMVKAMTKDMHTAVISKENISAVKETLGNVRLASRNSIAMSEYLKNILARADKLLADEDPKLRAAAENIISITRDIQFKLATIKTDKGLLRYFTTDDINHKIENIFAIVEKPLRRISILLSTMSKIDLLKAYAQGSRLAKHREKELLRMGKRTTREMLEEEYREEQKLIKNRQALKDLGAAEE